MKLQITSFKLAAFTIVVTTFLAGCTKDKVVVPLEENTISFNKNKMQIYRTYKASFTTPGCNNTVGGITIYGKNSNNDSIYIFVYNLPSYDGTYKLVEPLAGNECKVYIYGGFKNNGSSAYTRLKSGYSGNLRLTSTNAIFESDNSSGILPSVFTRDGSPQIEYECIFNGKF